MTKDEYETLEEVLADLRAATAKVETRIGQIVSARRALHFEENAHVLFPELRREGSGYVHHKTGREVEFTQYGYVEKVHYAKGL